MTDEASEREQKIIKRYPNRKMYDTEESTYVNLDELAEIIRDGIDVRVMDHKTGEDVTGMVLAQILYEEERKKQRALPAELMQRIVRFGEESFGPWVTKLFASTEHPMQGLRHEVEDQVRKLVDRGQLTADEANRFLKTWLDTTSHSLEDWQHRVDDRVVGVFDRVTGIPSLRESVDELLSRLDLMEKRLDVVEDRIRRTIRRLDATG